MSLDRPENTGLMNNPDPYNDPHVLHVQRQYNEGGKRMGMHTKSHAQYKCLWFIINLLSPDEYDYVMG